MSNLIQTKKIKGLKFSVLSPDTIENLSEAKIDKHNGCEHGVYIDGSPYDIRLGVLDERIKCGTCKNNGSNDPGHFGHIELATNIFHPLFLSEIVNVLSCSCLSCGNFLINNQKDVNKLINTKKSERIKLCKTLSKQKNNIICKICDINNDISYKIFDSMDIRYNPKIAQSFKFLDPNVVKNNFKKLKNSDIELMGYSPKDSRPEWFICDKIPVPPVTIRPVSILNEGNQKSEGDIHKHFKNIIKYNNKLKSNLGEFGSVLDEMSRKHYESLIFHITQAYTDRTKRKNIAGIGNMSGQSLDSIKDKYGGKFGYIRQYMEGKRVNYSARAVISGESKLKINEAGIPMLIAKKCTIAEVVNRNNIHRLKVAVYNGKDIYPGANKVKKYSDNKSMMLRGNKRALKEISDNLKYGDTVYRHMVDGDTVILNRQPSLHKLSILSLNARIIPNAYSIRLNNCTVAPFNADFDGDEMNVYIPHEQMSIAESREIMANDKNVIDPVSSNPIINPIQDNVLGLYFITKNGQDHISNDEFYRIVGESGYYNINRLWSIESENFNDFRIINMLECILPDDFTINKKGVNILNGKWISGVLNKGKIKMLIKFMYDDYGHENTSEIITSIQRLSDQYLMYRGFTVGISECILPDDIITEIKDNIENAKKRNLKLLEDYDNQSIIVPITMTYKEDFEMRVSNIISDCDRSSQEIIKKYLEEQERKGNGNNFMHMVNSKSKGSMINIYQIMGYIGQQSIEGHRILPDYGDRTSPHFYKYDNSLRSRGFVENSYLNGVDFYEFFCMGSASRIGLIDKSLKTADSGYSARKLTKLLECVSSKYDSTIRMYGDIISFSFGGYHWDTTKLYSVESKLYSMNVDDLLKNYSL